MKTNDAMQRNRRLVLQSAGASLVLWALPLGARAADARKGLRIGVIGSGRAARYSCHDDLLATEKPSVSGAALERSTATAPPR